MPTRPLPESYYDCVGLAQRAAWLQRENKARCEAAAARKAADPADPLDGFEFAVIPAEGPEAEPVEFEFDPPTR